VRFVNWSYSPEYWAYIGTLKAKLDQGHPVLVGVKLGIIPDPHPEWSLDHSILLTGYTPESFISNSDIDQRRRTFATTQDGMEDEHGIRWTLTNAYNRDYGIEFTGP
jgi:hypothetical protein